MLIKLNKKQMNFLKSTALNTGFVAGLGSGKSYVSTLKTILKKVKFKKSKIAYYLPTYGLVKDIAFDKFPEMLNAMGYKYTLNKSDKEIHIENLGKIIFRSMDNPENIVGYETFYTIIDECDILPMIKMETAYNKILARNRQVLEVEDNDVLENWSIPMNLPNGTYYHTEIRKLCWLNQLDIVGTPEGFKFFYKRYVEELNINTDILIKASTHENKHLPLNYISNLEQQYPEQLLKAYLNGEFVNLTSGTVYYFNRDKHGTDLVHTNNHYLYIGQDFNIGSCCSVVYIRDGRNMYAVDEFTSHDTFRIIDNVKKRYPYNNLEIIPDASGNQGQTNASKSDIQLIRDAGIKVNVPSSNPRVMDRINTTNNHFEKMNLFINVKKCPNYAKAMEQQAYDEKGVPEKFNGAGTIDDWCFSGDTKVIVNDKEIEIKDIPKIGYIRDEHNKNIRYENGGYKGCDNLCNIKLSNGIILKATKDHKFLTLNGWIEANKLKGETLCNIELYQMKSKSLKGINITREQMGISTKHLERSKSRKSENQENLYIEQYGQKSMGLYQKVMWFITKMKTKQIMISQILKLWNQESIQLCTQKNFIKTIRTILGKTLKRIKKNVGSGTNQKKGMNGTKNIMKKQNTNYIEKKCLNVSYAEKNMNLSCKKRINIVPTTAVQNREEIAESITKKENVLCAKKNSLSINIEKQLLVEEVVEGNLEKVYCLTTEKGYFTLSNGIITSNCDAGTYPMHRLFGVGRGAAKSYQGSFL